MVITDQQELNIQLIMHAQQANSQITQIMMLLVTA